MISNTNIVPDLDIEKPGRLTIFFEIDGYYVYFDGSQLQSNDQSHLRL